MTEGKPSKLLLQFAIPLIIGNLFQQAYTLADRVIVGQYFGAKDKENTASTIINSAYISLILESVQ